MKDVIVFLCPQCKARPGDRCRTSTRRPTRPHALRINIAKRLVGRRLSPGEQTGCPACSGQLIKTPMGAIIHSDTEDSTCKARR